MRTMIPLILGVALGATATYFTFPHEDKLVPERTQYASILNTASLCQDAIISSDSIGIENPPARESASATEQATLESLSACLAGLDSSVLISQLGAINTKTAARSAARTFFDAIGDDATQWDLAIEAVPPSLRSDFELEFLALQAERNPEGMLLEAFAFADPSRRRAAALRIARVWARSSPEDAIRVGAVPRELESAFRSVVAEEWASMDPQSFLEFAEHTDRIDELEVGLELLVANAPRRVFSIAARLPPAPNGLLNPLRESALRVMMDEDWASALAVVEATIPGPTRDALLIAAARLYAFKDPEKSLQWVDGFDSRVAVSAELQALSALAESDVDLAYDLAVERGHGGQVADALIGNAVAQASTRFPGQAAEVANQLVARGDERARFVLSELVSSWAVSDPDGAVAWMLANQAAIDPSLAARFVEGLSAYDVDAAIQLLAVVPSSWRADWLAQTAGSFARRDALEAFDWVQSFQGQPGYEGALTRIIRESAVADAADAARVLELVSEDLQADNVARIARRWTNQDAPAAAQWAAGLARPEISAMAVEAVALAWTVDDPAATAAWAIELPSGEIRDNALGALMQRSFAAGFDPSSVVREFESQSAQQEALKAAISQRVRSGRYLGQARALLEHVSDPEFRDSVESQLDDAR